MITKNKDVEALLEFAVQNNTPGTIAALKAFGYSVADTSDAGLFFALRNIWATEGIAKLEKVMLAIPLDKTKLTAEQAKNLAIKFKDVQPDAAAKFSDWFSHIGTSIGDLMSGSTSVNQNANISTQISDPVLSPTIVVVVVVLGIGSIVVLFAKGVKNALGAAIAIGAMVAGVIIFGSVAKKKTTTTTGGGGSQTVHNGALGWLHGILNGLHLSVAG